MLNNTSPKREPIRTGWIRLSSLLLLLLLIRLDDSGPPHIHKAIITAARFKEGYTSAATTTGIVATGSHPIQPTDPGLSGRLGRSSYADGTHNKLYKPQDRSQSPSDYLLRKPQLPPQLPSRPQDMHSGSPSGFSGFPAVALSLVPLPLRAFRPATPHCSTSSERSS